MTTQRGTDSAPTSAEPADAVIDYAEDRTSTAGSARRSLAEFWDRYARILVTIGT
jgi:hypothetical protein